VIGVIAIVIVLVVVIPVTVLMSGGAAAAVLGWVLRANAEADHAESPYLDLNR
jgi:hypothetical protein